MQHGRHTIEGRSDRTSPSPSAKRNIMRLGDTVKLVRRITNEPLEVTLTSVLTTSAAPAVEVNWKSDRYRYKLDLAKNEVLAIDSTQSHRQSMRAWYTVNEDDRKALTELYWSERKRRK